jgi:putative transposase
MNAPKCTEYDYINFLVAAQQVFSAVECITLDKGLLIIDDTTLDKPYASQMGLVTRHWSGKHHQVVQGINLISLVWSDGDAALPCDYRLYNKDQDGLGKNDHFRQMLQQAYGRGF